MQYPLIITTLLAAAPSALAQVESSKSIVFKVWKDPECKGDDFMEWDTTEPSGDTCSTGYWGPDDTWETNDKGKWRGYVLGTEVPIDCKLGLTARPLEDNGHCTAPYAIIRGSDPHKCIGRWFDSNFGTWYCCGEEMCKKSYIDPQSLPKESETRDVTAVKRSALLRPRDALPSGCKWKGGKPFDRTGPPVKYSLTLPCEQLKDCALGDSISVGYSFTQSFGISVELGASFLEVVSASTTFSYEYSYTHSETREVHHSLTQPADSTGYLTFSQYYECTTGNFEGTCDGKVEVGKEGDVCIPKTLAGGQPDGEIRFVEIW